MDVLKPLWTDHSTSLLTIVSNDLPQDFVSLGPVGFQETKIVSAKLWLLLYSGHADCAGWRRNDLHRLIILNDPSSAGRPGIQGAGVSLGAGFEISKAHTPRAYLSPPVHQDIGLSSFSSITVFLHVPHHDDDEETGSMPRLSALRYKMCFGVVSLRVYRMVTNTDVCVLFYFFCYLELPTGPGPLTLAFYLYLSKQKVFSF